MVVAGLTVHIIRFGLGHPHALGLVRMFDLNQEANVPTWFSSILLAICSTLLTLTALFKWSTGDFWFRHWAVLAGCFLAMSLDEAASIHELTMKPLRETFGLGGLLTNAWVLLAFILIPVFLVLFARFFISLPARSRKLLALSGSTYLVGAVGIEMFSGLVKSIYGNQHIRFAFMTTVEESVEMLGLALIIYALADYMARSGIELRLAFDNQHRSANGRKDGASQVRVSEVANVNLDGYPPV